MLEIACCIFGLGFTLRGLIFRVWWKPHIFIFIFFGTDHLDFKEEGRLYGKLIEKHHIWTISVREPWEMKSARVTKTKRAENKCKNSWGKTILRVSLVENSCTRVNERKSDNNLHWKCGTIFARKRPTWFREIASSNVKILSESNLAEFFSSYFIWLYVQTKHDLTRRRCYVQSSLGNFLFIIKYHIHELRYHCGARFCHCSLTLLKFSRESFSSSAVFDKA